MIAPDRERPCCRAGAGHQGDTEAWAESRGLTWVDYPAMLVTKPVVVMTLTASPGMLAVL